MRRLPLIAAALLLCGCGKHWVKTSARPQAEAPVKVRRLAVMPFEYNDSFRAAVEDPAFLTPENRIARGGTVGALLWKHLREASPLPFELVDAGLVREAFSKRGVHMARSDIWGPRAVPADHRKQTGFAVQDALEVGGELGADTVLLGAYLIAERGCTSHLSLRLLSTADGRVLWAGRVDGCGGVFVSPDQTMPQAAAFVREELSHAR